MNFFEKYQTIESIHRSIKNKNTGTTDNLATKIKEFLIREFKGINDTKKWLQMIDVEFAVEDDKPYFDITAIFHHSSPLDDVGKWRWSYNEGNCSQSVQSNDAGKIIAQQLRSDFHTYTSFWNDYHFYYTNVYTSYYNSQAPDPSISRPQSLIDGGLDNPVDNTAMLGHTVSTHQDLGGDFHWAPYGEGLTAYEDLCQQGKFHKCLSEEEIIYYYQQGKSFISSHPVSGYTTKNISITGYNYMYYSSYWPNENGGVLNGHDVYYSILHMLNVTRGIKRPRWIKMEEKYNVCHSFL